MDIQKETVEEFKSGHGSVGTSAAQVSEHALRAVKGVKIKADLGNSDNVYVGYDDTVTNTNGYQLDAGEEVTIEIDALNKVWVYGGASSQGYSWLVI